MELENNFSNTTPREDGVLLTEDSDVQNIDATYQTQSEIKETSPYWYLLLALIFDIVGLGSGLLDFLGHLLVPTLFIVTQVLAIFFALASIIQAFRSQKINQMDRKSRLDERFFIFALALLQVGWSGFCYILYLALRNWN